jgi:hypothetical protein
MKKTILLSMLFWLAFSAANITAQVRIGGASDPASSAILDLNPSEEAVATGGLLLPRVSLTSLGDNAVFGDNIPVAQGIMVYNLNDGSNSSRPAEGIYCYDGKKWLFVGIPDDCQPIPVTDIQFTGIRENGIILLNDEFEATAFPEGDDAAIYYRWSVPRDYFSFSDQGKRTIKLRNKGFSGIISNEIKVRAESRCGTTDDYANTTYLYAFDCVDAPEMPTDIMFSKTVIVEGEIITATALGSTAKTYDWTIPSEYFDIVGNRTQQNIQLKAKMVTPALTGEIRVSAANDCGKSGDYVNTTRISISSIFDCSKAPLTPVAITYDKKELKLNETVTLAVDIPSGSPVATKYNWTIPSQYFDIVGDNTQREIQLKAKMATSTTHEIRVNAENDCGKSSDFRGLIDIAIRDCSGDPPTPVGISFSKAEVQVDYEITATANLPSLIESGTAPVGYKWTIPESFKIVGSNSSQTVTLKAVKGGRITGVNAIGVSAYNTCGVSGNYYSFSPPTVICAGAPENKHLVKSSTNIIHYGQTMTLTAPFHEGMTYKWLSYDGYNVTITGNGNTATVTVTKHSPVMSDYSKLGSGWNIVKVTDNCGNSFDYLLMETLTFYHY